MLTEDQKAEYCKEVAECPAYLEKLGPYEIQALQQYVKTKRTELVSLPANAQAYYRLAFPAYALADVVAALFATPIAAAAPAAKEKPQTNTKLTLRQVALLHIYTGNPIPNSEANMLARVHGHTSGEKLYKHYNNLVQIGDRTHIRGRAVKPLIKDVQAVLPQLSGQQRKYAESELKTLESKIIDQS